ncbi:hypothetical protein GCM10011383_17110 [Hymenobacter cavernae]|uniref:DUF1232 domain-containing protein n=1 Tax=Hymenobacter cavernae TaxID=2044852 RepID=A0ABQ1TYA8_9BACT|nr:YkvA family protein [Hymenobacter cavernae]GGF06626.1 hypothetical protein GCM10011383_17110 [Hymenobacter cavernae]
MSSLVQKGLQISKNVIFNVFLQRAGKLLGKPFRVAVVLREVAAKLDDNNSPKGALQQIADMGRTLVRLVSAYITGSYRHIEGSTIVAGLAVLLYFLSPIDLVPDFIPMLGLLDDVALVSWFISKFAGEITRFREWESTSAVSASGVAPAPANSDRSLPAVAELGHS